ncbi:copper amine oxidase N-terminal domain-containing protein [Clostridiisalibacter paucivorans]|uniref:copper amine oxidase N-terminal domain-containing protein n=1 Tax=Clostridiisalibacter paucivorans TaxID=408753 RepID=UPI00047943D7|nr:copper amine oxidase N-terminal domain-containing protein [Clostridiisalibacter paucivorans]
MKFKNIVVLTIAGTVFVSSTIVSAEYNPNKKEINGPVTTTKIVTTNDDSPMDLDTDFTMVINGKGLDLKETRVYVSKDGDIMIPLRRLGKALGYEVKWNGEKRIIELIKENQYIMVKVDEDYYSFGRMAPMQLGTIPEINEGNTYVPLKFVKDVLRAQVSTDETGIINIRSDQSSNIDDLLSTKVGDIVSISKTDKDISILVEENILGSEEKSQIKLYIGDETKIVNPLTNEKLDIEDLNEGDRVRTFYGPMITYSIPPQSPAKRIEVLDEIDIKTGKITKIMTNKNSQILIGDRMNGMVLNISEETKIVNKDNEELKFEDLKEEMDVDVFHDLAVTRSLPPISNAKKIIVK